MLGCNRKRAKTSNINDHYAMKLPNSSKMITEFDQIGQIPSSLEEVAGADGSVEVHRGFGGEIQDGDYFQEHVERCSLEEILEADRQANPHVHRVVGPVQNPAADAVIQGQSAFSDVEHVEIVDQVIAVNVEVAFLQRPR